MKVIILAGGFGTRLSEKTIRIPKPMVLIGGKPILEHIINSFLKYDITNFYIALGYKSKFIKKFFLKKSKTKVSLKKKKIQLNINNKYNITLLETGLNTMTGGRIKKFKKIIKNEDFIVTYGDAVSDVNIQALINFHKKNKKIGTITSVKPPARFGELFLKGKYVKIFKEKPQMQKGWINGGFFIFNSKIFKFIEKKTTMLEKEPLERLVKLKQLCCYRHLGFWHCMDNKRDFDSLNKIYKKKLF